MLSEMLKWVEGMQVFQITGLAFFFIFFIGVIVWVFRQDKQMLDRMSALPLDDSNNNDLHRNKNHD